MVEWGEWKFLAGSTTYSYTTEKVTNDKLAMSVVFGGIKNIQSYVIKNHLKHIQGNGILSATAVPGLPASLWWFDQIKIPGQNLYVVKWGTEKSSS